MSNNKSSLSADALDRDRILVGDGGAVAGFEPLAVDRDGAACELNPAFASAFRGVRHLVAGREQGRIEIGLLVNDDRAVATVVRRDEPQSAALRVIVEVLFLVAGREPTAVGEQPDLEEMHGLALANG